ncbi:MAG: cytochrome c family protein [Candidatus Eisenbacteria bacterium]|uniref:Cytochrome c family protein n=1 Tax=Eiseniibacteriota bacterium TaxID=2212470 RepID=A0A933SAK0_UNCEI|nr:cytochrome c family protein [Candidatus Eisenbacteria bacterium]
MKSRLWIGLAVVTAIFAASFTSAQEGEAPAVVGHYVGVKNCKKCHSSAAKGAQYKQWSESKHSQAFLVLASPKALEIAAAKGIKDPQKAKECLECHVTGYGADASMFEATYSDSAGVGCESCHGPGSGYYKSSTMKAIKAGTQDGKALGLVMPTKEVCAKCHNERGTSGKPVNWPADSAKIAHPVPAGAAE